LARSRTKHPGRGFARTFGSQMEQGMGSCLDRGIKVVSNAGGLDPAGCAEAVADVADRLGLSPTIAHVDGDDLMPRLADLMATGALTELDPDAPLGPDPGRYITANAYLGCWGIVHALQAGADIVVTGRVTDAAVVCGPAAWHHGWARDDWDSLAGAVVAGHVIECGPQATGGNYSFFAEVPGMRRVGFPWAEVHSDGTSVIGKHDATGGEVSIGTVTSQLLYEIGPPAYLGPDVTARFDTIELTETGPDRVRISGTRGEPPPPTLKVAMNELGGYRNDLAVALTGLDIEAKAEVAEAAFWAACPYDRADYQSVITRVVRTDKADPSSNDEATARWSISVKDPDERKVGRAFSNAMVETALAGIPGMYLLSGGPTAGRAYGVYRPAKIPADRVPQRVTLLEGPGGSSETTMIESAAPAVPSPPEIVVAHRPPGARVPGPPTSRLPLGRVVGARSGDKGGHANLGVFTRNDPAWAWLDGFLSVERLRQLLPETAGLEIGRYRLPAIRSLNFVIRGMLEEGVAASTRPDAQAKSLGEWLRARVVDIPDELLDDQRGDLADRDAARPAPVNPHGDARG
ncbi:MAG: acyclic terpene utilization AtuA family protein, partial [Acidimicrobiales bacterium]